jgi:hypothetical protein
MIGEEKRRVLELFKEGRRLYTLHKFAEARDVFWKAIEIDKEDGPSRLYWGRCKKLIESPPKPDWDGVWDMKEK